VFTDGVTVIVNEMQLMHFNEIQLTAVGSVLKVVQRSKGQSLKLIFSWRFHCPLPQPQVKQESHSKFETKHTHGTRAK